MDPSPTQPVAPMAQPDPLIATDLVALAHHLMDENGLATDLPAAAAEEVASREGVDSEARIASAITAGASDRRGELWSSVDNPESMDLDQVELVERLDDGRLRLHLAIADVDAFVPRNSELDRAARRNAASVYAGVAVFPMLPRAVSEGLTSLLPDEDRLALVATLDVGPDGRTGPTRFARAVVRNQAKLTYEEVGAWLAGGEEPTALRRHPALRAQLKLQVELRDRLARARAEAGALDLETLEARPILRNGAVVDLRVVYKDAARQLIESFMVAANIATARFLGDLGRSGIRRVVREPARWRRLVEIAARLGGALPPAPDVRELARFLAERRTSDPGAYGDLSHTIVKLLGPGQYAVDRPGVDPGAHFGLAADDYTHATAPNRRYPDLVTQRLVKAALAGNPAPYTDEELEAVAAHCTARESATRKVERAMQKAAGAALLAPRIGERFRAVVTGVKATGVFARLEAPPVEGRILEAPVGIDVGDRVDVVLLRVDPAATHVDLGVAPG